MISPLLGLMLLLQVPATPHLKDAVHEFPRSMLQPRVSGPMSIDLKESARASYQAIADIAGLNVIFDPDVRDSALAPTHLENVDIFDALDRVSAATRTFVEVIGSKTILVAPDNQTKHRDYDWQVIQTIYPATLTSPQQITSTITMLRQTLNVRYIMTMPEVKAIVLRETPDRIAAAENLVAQADKITTSEPIALDHAGNLYVPDSNGVRKSSPSRSGLQVAATGPTSIDLNENSRTLFQDLAAMAGLNLVFDPDFRSTGPISLKFDNVDVLDALDYLALGTRTFWEPLDATTIMIAPDNQTKRRDYQRLTVKTIALPKNGIPNQETLVMTALRTLLNMRYLAGVSGANALAMMDAPTQLALAEKIIADLGQATPQAQAANALTLEAGNETGGVLRSRAVRISSAMGISLNVKGAGKISVDMHDTVRNTFERIAGMGGLHVTFDSRFQDGPAQPFAVKDVGILDALDFLSLQTRTFWEIMDATTILVAPDNQSVRRSVELRTEKVIHLNNTPTEGGASEIVRALKVLLNARNIATIDNGIAISDNVENVALAEKIVSALDR
jgi:hypothetical protein